MEPTEITVTFDSAIGTLPVPTRPGYTFVGWIDEAGNKVLESTVYEYVGDCKLTAQWAANAYTIHLDPNGGELSVLGITVEFGGKVNTLPVPTMVGYDFVGWFDAEGNEYTAETVYTVTGDVTLYAQWTESMDPPPTGDTAPMVVLSTASPYKFPAAVLSSLEVSEETDEFKQMARLEALTGVPIPGNLKGLETRKELHTDVIPKDKMMDYVLNLSVLEA